MAFDTSPESDLNAALYAASREGDVWMVELLLQTGAHVNAQGGLYHNALQVASREGRLAVVELLLQNGAGVNAQVGLWENPLYIASFNGDQRLVELLLQNGANVNAQCGFYGSALQVARMEGVIKLLLDYGAKPMTEPFIWSGKKVPISVARQVYRVLHISPRQEMELSVARGQATHITLEKEMAISFAALHDDWKNVRRLVARGYDPNYGKSFMERPLAVAIMNANMEEAEFLLRNYAIRDLGDQFYPLRDAILRKNVQEAQTILTRPRSLNPPKVETKRQTLQRHFHDAHKIFLIGSQGAGVGQEYKALATEMDSHKRMWRTGMAGVRRLIKNRSPQNLQQVIGILCIASAMRKSIQSVDTFGNHDLFLEDLDRWRELAIRPQQQRLFDEIVFAIWGKRQNSTRTPDNLDVQEEDRYILSEAIRKLVQRFVTESSLPLAQLEHENFWEYYESPEETSITLFGSRGSHNDNCESPKDPRIGSLPDSPDARDNHSSGDDPTEGWDWDPGLKSLVPVLLMMGAIFACVIHFLFTLHNGFVFLASSQKLSTQLYTSYRDFEFQTFTTLSTVEIQSNLRSAATSTLLTLEGWALIDRCELINSFLSHTIGWVPSIPASTTGESFDPFLFDSESNSLLTTILTPSTPSSSGDSTTSRRRCCICDTVFSSAGNLNRHLKRHQDSRKHSCQNAQLGCRYLDIRKDNVEKHEIKHCKWRRYVSNQNHHR